MEKTGASTKVYLSFSIENILRGTTRSHQNEEHRECPAGLDSPATQDTAMPRTSTPAHGSCSAIHPIPEAHPWHRDGEASISPVPSDIHNTSIASTDSGACVDINTDTSSCKEHTDATSDNDENRDPAGGKSKKLRTTFSVEQVRELEDVYSRRRYIPAADRRKLAARLKLSDQQVKTWFQNRRMKEKRVDGDRMIPFPLLPNLHVAVHPSPLAGINQDRPPHSMFHHHPPSLPGTYPVPQQGPVPSTTPSHFLPSTQLPYSVPAPFVNTPTSSYHTQQSWNTGGNHTGPSDIMMPNASLGITRCTSLNEGQIAVPENRTVS